MYHRTSFEKGQLVGDGLMVNQSAQLDELLICRLNEGHKTLTPCSIIIFGASGDLTARKLVPALYHLALQKQMPADYRVIGIARREKTDASWRGDLRSALEQLSLFLHPKKSATEKDIADLPIPGNVFFSPSPLPR